MVLSLGVATREVLRSLREYDGTSSPLHEADRLADNVEELLRAIAYEHSSLPVVDEIEAYLERREVGA